MSRMVRRLAALAVILVVVGVPGVSLAAAPVEQGPGDSPAAQCGGWDVLGEVWAWMASVFGADQGSGDQGNVGTQGTNAEDEDPPGGGGDHGPGADPNG